MTVHHKACRDRGQPIELRRGDDGVWRPFDLDGSPHDCPARPFAPRRSWPGATTGARSRSARSPWALLLLAAAALLFVWSRASGPGGPEGQIAPSAPAATAPADRGAAAPTAAARVPGSGCDRFDSQVWAQSVYDADPAANRGLDPDGDGLACDTLPRGAAPALWANEIPRVVEQVELLDVIDGDTIRVRRGDGAVEDVRLVGLDTPETGMGTRPLECYGPEASAFAADLFDRADGVVYLEQDLENRDRYDRLLRYVWFADAEGVYLANEAVIRAGYGERFRDTPNRRYLDQLIDAEAFAQRHGYGLWSGCA